MTYSEKVGSRFDSNDIMNRGHMLTIESIKKLVYPVCKNVTFEDSSL